MAQRHQGEAAAPGRAGDVRGATRPNPTGLPVHCFGSALHRRVKVVAVNDPEPAAISSGVNAFRHDFNTAEPVTRKSTRKFIMVARNKHHTAALAHV